MLQEYWFGLALFAGACTAAWLFRPHTGTTVTSFLAFVGWTLAAVFGGEVDRLLDDGSTAEAAVPDEIRLFIVLLALLSFLAFVLYRVGVYPPQNEQPFMEEQ